VKDAKHLAKRHARSFLSLTRKPIQSRRTHWAVNPLNAGIHTKKTQSPYTFTIGPRHRGAGAAARFAEDFYLPVGFNAIEGWRLPFFGPSLRG
jgi:hypothetical protein